MHPPTYTNTSIMLLFYFQCAFKYKYNRIFCLGVELRKVDRNEQKEERNDTFRDVDLILSRRVAVQISDSDSSSSNGYDSDSWAEEICPYTFTNCSSSETPRKL